MMNQNDLDDLQTTYQDLMDLPVAAKNRDRMRDALSVISRIIRVNRGKIEARISSRTRPDR